MCSQKWKRRKEHVGPQKAAANSDRTQLLSRRCECKTLSTVSAETGDSGNRPLLLILLLTQLLLSLPTELVRMKTFLSHCRTKSFVSGLYWLVVAFLRGLTGKAMMSAFLSTVRCQLRWTFQTKDQGKGHSAQPCVL